MFGVIKDISVANILSSDKDKTRDFAGKDFSQMYSKHVLSESDEGWVRKGGELLVGSDEEIENLFEPRPPHPESTIVGIISACGGTVREKCVFTENEAVSMIDPWTQHLDLVDDRPANAKFFRPWNESESLYSNTPHLDTSLGTAGTEDLVNTTTTNNTLEGGSELVVRGNESYDQTQKTLDPAKIVISSEVLESLLQGAEGYSSSERSMEEVVDDTAASPSDDLPLVPEVGSLGISSYSCPTEETRVASYDYTEEQDECAIDVAHKEGDDVTDREEPTVGHGTVFV